MALGNSTCDVGLALVDRQSCSSSRQQLLHAASHCWRRVPVDRLSADTWIRVGSTYECLLEMCERVKGCKQAFELLSIRPELRQDYPLNLSISISGGKETNKDSLSNGE